MHALGPISALEFSREAGRELLWTASSRGVLRLDYASLAPAKAPAPPLIRLTTPPPGRTAAGPPTFAFARHRVGFTSFTSDFALSRDWLTQVRLGHGEWSTPAPRIHYEFTNLSEGDYRFEIRARHAGRATGRSIGLFVSDFAAVVSFQLGLRRLVGRGDGHRPRGHPLARTPAAGHAPVSWKT